VIENVKIPRGLIGDAYTIVALNLTDIITFLYSNLLHSPGQKVDERSRDEQLAKTILAEQSLQDKEEE
jgi:hypothetical protein